jgi:hypothetical protein
VPNVLRILFAWRVGVLRIHTDEGWIGGGGVSRKYRPADRRNGMVHDRDRASWLVHEIREHIKIANERSRNGGQARRTFVRPFGRLKSALPLVLVGAHGHGRGERAVVALVEGDHVLCCTQQ